MNIKIAKFVVGSLAAAGYVGYAASSDGVNTFEGKPLAKVGKVRVHQSAAEPGAITLYWRGEINETMGRHMVSALKKYRRDTNHFIIDISSPGGYVHSGEELIRYLKRMKASHTIETRVPDSGICLSMCVPIFLNGEKRYAGADTRFMFHRPWVKEPKFGKSAKQKGHERRFKARLNSKMSQEAWRFYNVHFRASPIAPDWLRQLNEQWKVKDNDYWTDGEELMRQKSNVVTHML